MTAMEEKRALTAEESPSVDARFDRRMLIRRGAGIAVGFAGAGTLTGVGFAAQQDASTPDATAASPEAGNETTGIAAAANAFFATLSTDEQATVLFDWSNDAQRQRWSNFPPAGFDRAGLMWGNLGQATQDAWLTVLQTTLSTEGYKRVLAEWQADDALFALEGSGGGFGMANYFIALIGKPSETDPWQWQWGGHHVTVNATIDGSHLALTPSFIGAQPATYTDANGATVKPLGEIEEEALALVGSFDSTQQGAAVLGDARIDLVLGPGQDGKTIQPEGLPASQMTADQQSALLHLIGHYTGLANDAAAKIRMQEIEANIADTYFAWYGPTTGDNEAYWRVTGPTVVIEYAPQGAGQGGNGGATDPEHVHGMYRHPTDDYGAQETGVALAS